MSPAIRPLALLLLAAWTSGCSTPGDAEVLEFGPHEYGAAFDAAVEAARRAGLAPVFRDRRAGVIETEARVAGSVLEPWRTDNASLDQAVENTLAHQRRRARFEFTAAGFQEPHGASAAGPDVLGIEPLAPDLTQTKEPLELRVWVFVERTSAPGIKRSTWTRSVTSVSPDWRTERREPEGRVGGGDWITVARDRDYEKRLLHQVAGLVNPQGSYRASE